VTLIFWAWHAHQAGHQAVAAAQAPRVAVTRFDNDTGDPQFDQLADELSDSVTARLTTSSGDRYGVIGNAAILRLPRSQRDLTAIGSSLNARYVVLAQVRKDSSHFFVLAHLIRLPEQTHVAVTEITCATEDSLQDLSGIAQHIADKFSPLIAQLDMTAPPHKAM
jgi:TolB-like protein